MRALEVSSLRGRFTSAEQLRCRHAHPWLVWSVGDRDLAWPLEAGGARPSLSLGRSSRADAYVPDPALAEVHLLLAPEGPHWSVRTAEAAHPAWLNGWRLGHDVAVRLYPGDTLRAGTGSFTFESPHRFFERIKGRANGNGDLKAG
jgi:hypothetical protein